MADFDDLISANRTYAEGLDTSRLEGRALAGLAVVTCMDSRIDPLAMLGLSLGDAKVVRNPGGRVTPQALDALVLAVHFLAVDRILVVPHTRCAVATNTEATLREGLADATGTDVAWQTIPVTEDQDAALAEDVRRVRSHPLIPDSVQVAGFVYDVETGLLERRV